MSKKFLQIIVLSVAALLWAGNVSHAYQVTVVNNIMGPGVPGATIQCEGGAKTAKIAVGQQAKFTFGPTQHGTTPALRWG